MRNTPKAILAAVFAIPFSAHAGNFDFSSMKPYVGVEYGQSEMSLDSGGFNTAGTFPNTNDDTDTDFHYGLNAGVRAGDWQFGLSYTEYEGRGFVTDSFAPPTPTFFYTSKMDASKLMAEVTYTFYRTGNFGVHANAGLGMSHVKLKTNDGVVSGSGGTENNLAWQGGIGVSYSLSEALLLTGGYRYVDLGSSGINLLSIGGGGAAGTFTADLESEELSLGIQYQF